MPEPEPLHPAVSMFVSGRHVETRVMEALGDAGYDLTLAQARLAARISEGGSRLTTLAEAAQLTKQSAGFLVDQLEASGLVERVPDPRDARAKLVRFSRRGRQLIALAREVERQVAVEWEQHLGPRRYRELSRSLEKLREITDPFVDDN